ncbi:MAG: osmotically inducible protein OsmC [Chloroflexi bacterium RBG_16_64_43]|nr:MAG: osmotically inducible protein OsmC [Chloroflexi bacterium RBG_16_64_43]
MNAAVVWKSELTFEGMAGSGFRVPLGAAADVGGAEDGFRPMELMALSLAGCTAMDVISILQRKLQAVTAFEVRVEGERATEHPKVFTRMVVEYRVRGRGIDPQAVDRAVALSRDKYCPAQGMLAKVVPIEHRVVIEQDPPGE